MPVVTYYKACLNISSVSIPYSGGVALAIPPRQIPPDDSDFQALDRLAQSGELRDYRYIEGQSQPIFLATRADSGDR
jgi:hypothetical protein